MLCMYGRFFSPSSPLLLSPFECLPLIAFGPLPVRSLCGDGAESCFLVPALLDRR